MSKPAGYWEKWENIEKELGRAIKKNRGAFPSRRELREMGFGGLVYGIERYHGGLPAARERIGYHEAIRKKLAKDLEKIVETL